MLQIAIAMDQKTNQNSEVYNHYLQLCKPTKEDFERVFTVEELKELCLKHKCRVDMWKWNVVDDYRVAFTKSGRFQRWSEKERLGMLAKAVNKMKPAVLYDENEINRIRKKEWELQLKDNILSLDFWKRQRIQRFVMAQSSDIVPETQNLIMLQSNGRDSQVVNSQEFYSELDREIQLEIEVNTESANGDEVLTENQMEKSSSATNREVSSREVRSREPSLDENSRDSVDTVLLNQHQTELHSEEVAPEIANIYDVNTISMTIDSQISTQSQNFQVMQSQDVLPTNYDHFKNTLPLTSTQSQNSELILS